MKKMLCATLVVLLLVPLISSVAQSNTPAEIVRGVSWGMTQDEIKAIEEGGDMTPDSTDKLLGYRNVKAGGLNALLIYAFNDDGQCHKIVYSIDEKHSNKNDYIDDYNKLKDSLAGKYSVLTDDIVWKNDLYKNSPKDYGRAVSAGHLVYMATFENDETDITMTLSGDNYDIKFFLTYASKEIEPPAPKEDNSI